MSANTQFWRAATGLIDFNQSNVVVFIPVLRQLITIKNELLSNENEKCFKWSF